MVTCVRDDAGTVNIQDTGPALECTPPTPLEEVVIPPTKFWVVGLV